jgi:WD40 repeat protein
MSLYFMGEGRNCFGHTASLNSVHFQKDSEFIWTASCDKSARSFRVSSGGANKTLQWHSGGLTCITAHCDGSVVITGGLDCAAVVTWTQQTSNQAPLHILAHDSALSCVALTPDGGSLVSCSVDGAVMLWRAHELTKLPRLKKFDVQNQMFEDEHREYQTALEEHKTLCLRSCAAVSSTAELLNWGQLPPIKRDKVPSFSVSATAHDSVSAACCATGAIRSKGVSCGIQRFQFFNGNSGLACASGRRGVAMLRVDA